MQFSPTVTFWIMIALGLGTLASLVLHRSKSKQLQKVADDIDRVESFVKSNLPSTSSPTTK